MNYRCDDFSIGYIECALWSSIDDNGHPLDDSYSWDDIDREALRSMLEDCAAFQRDNSADLEGHDARIAGADFWLTRNGHGAGYWDGFYGYCDGYYTELVGKRLTDAAHAYGGCGLIVGDDQRLYI